MKKKVIIGCIILILIIGVGAAAFLFGDRQKDNKESSSENVIVNTPNEDMDSDTEKTESADTDNSSEAAAEGGDWYNLPGYINGVTKDEEQKVCGLDLPYTVQDTPIVIEGIGQYTGPFVEDGSDEPLANVLGIVVKNDSDKVVEFAELRFKINDSEEAVFHISTLPAGSSAVVLENNRREYNPEEIFSFSDKLYSQLDKLSLMEDQMEVTAQDQKLTVKNLTDKDLGTIYVRYKAKLNEDYYLGGITYSCKIGGIGAGQSGEAETEHFTAEGSQVLMVEAIEE